MTRGEFAEIVAMIKGVYADPKFIADTVAMETWYLFFKDYDYKTIMDAASKYIQNDDFGKAPCPGQIIANIDTGRTFMDAEDAWALTYEAITRSIYHSSEEYEKLPEECKRAIGSPLMMRTLATMDNDTVTSVNKAQFIRAYKSIIERQIVTDRTPNGLLEIREKVIERIECPKKEEPKVEQPKPSDMPSDEFIDEVMRRIRERIKDGRD